MINDMLFIILYNLVVVMDEGNSVAENGILGSVGYVERNNLGKVQGKHLLSLENSIEPYQTFERRKEI